ncbi:THAP domain [Popillia japonica]|uniref:THAP domain n=1 Tax=Popillia japonica TaxID=7064 RepID=A0AAW1IE26_POPJA
MYNIYLYISSDKRHETEHRFPHPDKKQELCKLWVQLTGNKHLQSLPLISVYKSHVICHQHFRGEDCKQKTSALNNELLSTYCNCKCEKLLKITKTGDR